MSQDALDFDGDIIRDTRPDWRRGKPRCVLRASRTGDAIAVANTFGSRGAVVDASTGRITMRLSRGEYHEDVCVFPLAFCEHNGRSVVIHGTDWNRVDASDALTGSLLTTRHPTSYKQGEARPPHYLDYFHCGLTVSPNGTFIADDGWVWAPVGVVTTWSLQRWLNGNVWESEDGDSKKQVTWRHYHWDGSLCWLDDERLAVWGYGGDDEYQIAAVLICNAITGETERWFAGPIGTIAFGEYLFSYAPAQGTSAWDPVTGERLAHERDLCPVGHHRAGRHFLSFGAGGMVRISRLVGSEATAR